MACFDRFNALRRHVAIDVGTAFLRVASGSSGVVTIPAEAAPAHPLRGGVITDPGGVTALLRPEVLKSRGLGLLGPAVLVGAPTDAQASERKALLTVLYGAGAGHVQIVPEPLAAAAGASLDISLPYAQMVLDVGEGVTDCIILRNGAIVRSGASRVGCGTLRERVRQKMRVAGERALSPAAAERMVASIGVRREASGRAPDRSRESGNALAVETPEALRAWMEETVEAILSVPATLLREAPADIGSEIIESGILLTGGGALIPGLRERLAAATSIRVSTPDAPLEAVVRGLQSLLPG